MARKAATFAERFDAAASRPNPLWSDNSQLAEYIRRMLATAGLGKTNRVQVSRWRNGLTEPHVAVQALLLALIEGACSPAKRAPRRRA